MGMVSCGAVRGFAVRGVSTWIMTKSLCINILTRIFLRLVCSIIKR